MAATLHLWSVTGLAEIYWLADWGEAANHGLRELLRLPEFPVLPRDRGEGDDSLWWKWPAVQKFLEGTQSRPLVWIDDDLRYAPDVVDAVQARTPPTLLVAPQVHLGLTPKQLEQVRTIPGLSSSVIILLVAGWSRTFDIQRRCDHDSCAGNRRTTAALRVEALTVIHVKDSACLCESLHPCSCRS